MRHPYPSPYYPNVSSTLWLGRPLAMSLRLKAAKPYGKWDLPVARVGVGVGVSVEVDRRVGVWDGGEGEGAEG